MNCDTGELRKIANLDEMFEAEKEGFTRVPEELLDAAERKLKKAGNKRAFVSLTSGGKLSKFAAGERKKKRKMAKAARRKNR